MVQINVLVDKTDCPLFLPLAIVGELAATISPKKKSILKKNLTMIFLIFVKTITYLKDGFTFEGLSTCIIY